MVRQEGEVVNFQPVHYVQLVCASLATGLPQVESAFPVQVQPYFKGASAICILVASCLGVFSPDASTPAAAAVAPVPK
jgi:hypothetical protein